MKVLAQAKLSRLYASLTPALLALRQTNILADQKKTKTWTVLAYKCGLQGEQVKSHAVSLRYRTLSCMANHKFRLARWS